MTLTLVKYFMDLGRRTNAILGISIDCRKGNFAVVLATKSFLAIFGYEFWHIAKTPFTITIPHGCEAFDHWDSGNNNIHTRING